MEPIQNTSQGEKHKDTSTERSQMSSCDEKNWEVNGKMTVKQRSSTIFDLSGLVPKTSITCCVYIVV